MTPAKSVAHLADVVGGTLIPPPGGMRGEAVYDVTHDSRRAGSATLFVAIRGEVHDGHRFVKEAVAAGSPAVCVDRAMGSPVAELVVGNTRSALGPLAAAVHDHPSRGMPVIGVTGTNGKTTVTHYIEAIAEWSGRSPGLIGTIATRVNGKTIESAHTTPEASDFQRLLATMRDSGADLVAVEVSSHALVLDRVKSTRFEVAAFTNLSQDHLDFHRDMDSYLDAKKRLFNEYEVGTAVINIADPAGAAIAGEFGGELLTVGPGGDIVFESVATGPEGSSFWLQTPWGESAVDAPVFGDFNVSNAVMAMACCVAAGVDPVEALDALGSLPVVPGRYEQVSENDEIRVVVDYAHSPEGIRKAIEAASEMTDQRVLAVVGAGGDRDKGKRPEMGAAGALADILVITSDNPRSEDPEAIIADVASGIGDDSKVYFEVDRRRAFERVLGLAEDGDLVLILGRGHEPYQDVGGELIPFDDRAVARSALARIRGSAVSADDSGSMEP